MPETSVADLLRRLDGEFWRVLAPRWAFDPLSGEGAARNGGRYNPKGVAALYMSGDLNTAVAEYQQDLRNRPGTFCVYRIRSATVADLRDGETLDAVGATVAALSCPWRRLALIDGVPPPTWSIATSLIDAGVHGALAPSTQFPGGVNLVLWHWNEGEVTVEALDPAGDLPRNQASWRLTEGES